jgi:hypothetical protein
MTTEPRLRIVTDISPPASAIWQQSDKTHDAVIAAAEPNRPEL